MTTWVILLLLLVFGTSGVPASHKDVYVAASGQGQMNGNDCANALSYGFFDKSSNWGTGPQKIGPGTTVHVCGIIKSPGTSSVFEFLGSGTPENPITLNFEADAALEAPYWGTYGAISCHDQQYVVVDGGSNGTIRATANGTELANHKDGSGVHLQDCSNSEIRNLNISNIYIHASPSDERGEGTYGIFWSGGSNVQIHNNTAHDAKWCFFYAFPGGRTSTTISVFSNSTYRCDHGIVIGSGNADAVLGGTNLVHDNVSHDWANWDDDQNNNHHDSIHIWAAHPGSQIHNLSIYNNDSYGQPGTHMNAHIYVAGGPGDIQNAYIFNNVMTNPSSNHIASGFICDYGIGTHIFNNTMKGSTNSNEGGQTCINVYLSGEVSENNICSTAYVGIYLHPNSSIEKSDYNDFHDVNAVGFDGKNWYNSISSWSHSTGHDKHSTSRDPQLTATYHLADSKSGAWRAGDNLNYVGDVALTRDRKGTLRLANGAWDMGAYEDSTLSTGSKQ